MPNPLYTSEQLFTTSLAALREFDDRYIAALASADASGWADSMGALIPTSAPLLTFPISQLSAKYQRSMGEGRAKTLGEKSFDLKAEEYDEGFEESLMNLYQNTFAVRRWNEAPGAMIQAEKRLRHAMIAAKLEDGENIDFLDTGKKFFSATHKANLFEDRGSFSNYQSSTKDVVDIGNIEDEVVAMMQVKDSNGNFLGVQPDTILVPVQKAEPLKNLLKQAMIANWKGSAAQDAAAVNNPYMNGFNVVPVAEFTDADDWYLVDSKLIKVYQPWVILRQTVPASLGLRRWDESTDFFRSSGKIRVESHVWYGSGLALPHAIRKIKGA